MTLAEFKTQLETSGLPVAYLRYPAEEVPSMPFVTYQETGSNNFGADGKVYHKIKRIQVDLWTTNKDLQAEEALENALDGLFWDKVQTVDEGEACQRYTYEIEI